MAEIEREKIRWLLEDIRDIRDRAAELADKVEEMLYPRVADEQEDG